MYVQVLRESEGVHVWTPCVDFSAKENQDERIPRARSSGSAHSAFVQLGLHKRQVKQLSLLSYARDDDKMNLVRNVFGEFAKSAVKGGVHISQNLVLYSDPSGDLGGFDYASDAQRAMSRQQNIGIYSHIAATRTALERLLSSHSTKHAIDSRIYRAFSLQVLIAALFRRLPCCDMKVSKRVDKLSAAEVTVVSDDTNVWVNNASQKRLFAEGVCSETKPVKGMKRVQSLLGLLQHLIIRTDGEPDGVGTIAQVHAPCQLLPRANSFTILDRLRRWSLYASVGCAEPYGGRGLWDLFTTVPLELIVHCRILSRHAEAVAVPYIFMQCCPGHATEVEMLSLRITLYRPLNTSVGTRSAWLVMRMQQLRCKQS